MKKVLFIDRDGTIIAEPPDEQVDSFEKMIFLPSAISCLSLIAKETDFELVLVTNQDGLGTESFPEETFWPVQNKMLQILKGEGVVFREIFIDRTMPADNAPTRKPGTALLVKYLAGGVDLDASFVIGDRHTDIQLAKNLGCKSIYMNSEKSADADFSTNDWNEIYKYLKPLRLKSLSILILMDQGKAASQQALVSLIICWNRLPGTETLIWQFMSMETCI
jgi:imidazoleglycerol-phosphate dehydratase/histidinol-phosphatase